MNARPSLPGSRSAFRVVIAGVLIYVVLDVIVQSLPPHYNPISQAESDLAVGPYGYIMTLNFVNRGLLSLVFVYALSMVLLEEGESRRSLGLSLLAVWGLGALLLAIFPTDVPATPVSGHGAIHLLVAAVAFLAGAFGTVALSQEFHRLDSLKGIAQPAKLIADLAVVFALVTLGLGFIVKRLADQIGGLDERIFLGLVLLWMTLVSVHLLRSRKVAAGTVAQS
ncbi:MAG: DUF998 domain-containing protein [Thaumarchaeota archaeon]|nr:DUF998 domain-containing protein [Nitrososphaerota archaeon]